MPGQPANSSTTRVAILDHTAAMGGGEVALLNLARNLDPLRVQLLVVLFSDGPLREKLDASGIATLVLPLDAGIIQTRKDSIGGKSLLRFGTLSSALGFVRRLARELKARDIQIVHTNSLKSDILGGLAGRWAGIPVLWHVRDRIAGDYLPGPVAIVFRVLARIIPRHVIAISLATLNTLRIRHGDGEESAPVSKRFTVVYDGTIVPPISDTPVASDQLLVGLVGRISPWKGQHVFLRAIALIRSRFPNAKFQIIGSALFSEGDYEKQVRGLSTSLGLDDIVEFTGFRDDVAEMIGCLDVLVHASTLPEPFGQVILEGMAAGRAVVATRGGGVPEFVEDGVTGILVPMDDIPALADAMARLLGDRHLREQMGHRARQHVIESFTVQHTAARVMGVYDGMLDTFFRRL